MGGRAVVMGLGLFGGGTGAVRHLVGKGYRVLVTDLRGEAELASSIAELADLNIDYRLGEHRIADFQSADLVVKNPGVKPGSEYVEAAKRSGATITSELRLFMEDCPAMTVGVTGSNGKTTTAHMAAAMLRAEFGETRRVWLGGNVGGSLLSDLPDIQPGDVVVLEISSFQLMDLDEAGLSPDIAAITNITPNHLDWHRDYAEYVRAKTAIYRHQAPENTVVLNADDPVTSRLHEGAPSRVVRFGLAGSDGLNAWREGNSFTLRMSDGKDTRLFSVEDVRLPGAHNLSNALCAACMASCAGATPRSIATALRSFRGVEHRLEPLGTVAGVRWYNDSIATTPESTIAALDSFDREPVALLLGGSDKGLAFDALAEAIARKRNVRVVYLDGPVAPKIASAIRRACTLAPDPLRNLNIESVTGFDEAIARAATHLESGSVFLMSPACASFYEYAPGKKFRNFEHRGQHFKALVAALEPSHDVA